jgi:hypothetical protein
MIESSTSPSRPSVRTKDLIVATAVALVGIGVFVVVNSSGAAFGHTNASAVISVLSTETGVNDRLPAGFPVELHGEGGLVSESARFLGADHESGYWVVLDSVSNVCLVTQSLKVVDATAAACANPNEVEVRALDLKVSGPSWQVESFLVPDSVDVTGVSGAWKVLGPNLVVVSGPEERALLTLERSGNERGAAIVLQRVPENRDLDSDK